MIGFAVIMVIIQRIGFAVLSGKPAQTPFLDAMIIAANAMAIGSSLIAAMRARGASRIFWLLFGGAFALQMVADVGWTWVRFAHIAVPDGALFPSIFYRLYAGPMAIALFLSEDVRTSKFEKMLDGCIVVGLVGLSVYQIQIGELNTYDPQLWRVITVGTGVNVLLMVCAVARYALAPDGRLRGLFGRQAIFLSVYAAVSLITSIGDAHFPDIDASIDLIWILTYLAGAVVALTWHPLAFEQAAAKPRISRRASLMTFNVTLATMVLGCTILGLRVMDRTRVVSLLAISVVLFSYAIRSALMQDKQEKYLEALNESKAQLQHQALYDELTGLANRRLLTDRLASTLAMARRENRMCALLYVDLDGFKPVNDRLGHAVGDELLCAAAIRMAAQARESDTLVRMGGDEFTLLLSHIPSRDHAALVADDLLRALSEPFIIEGHEIRIGASIGIGVFPKGARDAEALIHQADCAMYAVKRDGGNGMRYYATDLESGACKGVIKDDSPALELTERLV